MLTFLGAMAALYGGGLVAWLYGGMSPSFLSACGRDLDRPFHRRHDQGAGDGAGDRHRRLRRGTRGARAARIARPAHDGSVVKVDFLVIVMDGVFAIFFASIGM